MGRIGCIVEAMTQTSSIQTLIAAHLTRYPVMELLDVYRLLHQATFGSPHSADEGSQREWTRHEWDTNPPAKDSPLLESVSPDETWLRLHLRPYRAAGGAFDPLLTATLGSAAAHGGQAETLDAYWDALQELISASADLSARFAMREVVLFGQAHAAQHFPAEQHSPAFIDAYRPAYRVLHGSLARDLLTQQGLDYHPLT